MGTLGADVPPTLDTVTVPFSLHEPDVPHFCQGCFVHVTSRSAGPDGVSSAFAANASKFPRSMNGSYPPTTHAAPPRVTMMPRDCRAESTSGSLRRAILGAPPAC